ncbi:MAG: methionyl-tRNA formyltransferase [Phycisphaerales bacterium]
MKVIFLGSGAIGLPTLRELSKLHDVQLVVSQPARPAGRRRTLTPTPIAAWANQQDITTITPENVNDSDIIAQLHAVNADAWVVIAYGQKLSRELLSNNFAINLHASLLPAYRGAAPINWAIMHGENQTGLSVITVADRMDAGDILGQITTPIDPMETAGELHDRLALLGPDLILEVLDKYERNTLTPVPQDHALATRAPKLSKHDGTVTFNQSARGVQARIHGLTPWPGCSVQLIDHDNVSTPSILKLSRVMVVREEDDDNGPAGAAPGQLDADGCVQCDPGKIRILALQPPGKKIMDFSAWVHGHVVGPACFLRKMDAVGCAEAQPE